MPDKCDKCNQEDWAMHVGTEWGKICCDCMNELRDLKDQNERPDRRPIRPT